MFLTTNTLMFKKKFKVREGDSGGKQLIDKSHSQVVESGRFRIEFWAENRPRASVLNNQEIGLNLKPRSAASPKVRKHSENSQGKNIILEATRAVTISNR